MTFKASFVHESEGLSGMDAALQVADVAKGYLQTAWNAAAAYHDRLEPVGAKVAAAQACFLSRVVQVPTGFIGCAFLARFLASV